MPPLLPFEQDTPAKAGVRRAVFLQRVKRFSIELLLPERDMPLSGITPSSLAVSGKSMSVTSQSSPGTFQTVWAHSNNSGSMLGLLRRGSSALISPAPGEKRKLHWTLELLGLHQPGKADPLWVGVNTMTPNRLLKAAFAAGRLPWAEGYEQFTPECKRGSSRLDACLTAAGKKPLWVECKNVTLVEDGGVAAFPDAASERGCKHLRELMDIVASGERAACFYLIQRADARCFAPADYVDPEYARLLGEAVRAGVEIYPHLGLVDESGIDLGGLLPVVPFVR